MNLTAIEGDWSNLEGPQVWTAFKAGNKDAFSYIYQSHIKQLFNYGMQVIQNPDVVEDGVQDLFVDLWKRRKRLSSTDNIRFYLMKGLRNKLIDFIRDNSRLQTQMQHQNLPAEANIILPYESVLVEKQALKEQKKILFRALTKLPPKQKEVIHLLFYEKLSYEKVSEMMSINLKSVYTLAWKALNTIRKNPEFRKVNI